MSANRFDDHHEVLVARLPRFGRNDVALAGGKGANLGELYQAGFNVPPGFIITTAAYDLLLQENKLYARLASVLTSFHPNDPVSANSCSQQMQILFQQAIIPVPVTDQVLTAYRTLAAEAVAVRSSATAEDLPEAAFAGQQETFLNVIGEEALMDAIRACWMSLWSERAILYRARQNVNQETVKLAVVVQELVPADVAGVMFTADPVSGARNEIIIDANPGLGEAVVSGLVTPDHYVVKKSGRRLKEQRLGRREVIVRPKSGSGTEQVSSAQGATSAALSLPSIRKLAQLGIDIERHYGTPQDVEWAWMGDKTKPGKLFILQARPMTALPEPIHVRGPMRLVVPMLAEMWLTRPYPLDMTTFTGAVERAIGNLLVTIIGKSAPNPDEAFFEQDGVVVEFRPPQIHPSPSMLLMPWITLWRTRHYEPAHWEADPRLQEFITQAQALEKRNLKERTWEQNIQTLHEALALIPRAMELRERYLPQALLGFVRLWLVLALTGHRDRFGALISGVRTKTTETNQTLEELARQLRQNPRLQDLLHRSYGPELRRELEASQAGQVFLTRFESFLERYGHRETSLSISQPAWKDQPDTVLAILNVLAKTESQEPDSYNAWQRIRDELLAHSVLGRRIFRHLFLKSLTNARALFEIREDTHFYATLVQPTIRRIVLELAQRLVRAGALDRAEDIFHLRLDELEFYGDVWPPSQQTLGQLRALVARRKAKRESLANKPMVDPRLLATASQIETGENILLRGTSGSPGVARGPAKIVHDVTEFGNLQAGDVLVSPATNPAWTALFQRAVAVVVDTGGAASHAAIVAREYGIPAVMGTMNGTRELKDGQWITVDGSRGLVLKGEKPT